MPDDPKKWLLEHMPPVSPDATATSAEQIRRIMQPTGSSMEARQLGNIPAPMPAPKETREGWIMSHLSDLLPIVGEMRGVQAGFQSAKEGHPILGGALAAMSVLPGATRSLKELARSRWAATIRRSLSGPCRPTGCQQSPRALE